MPDAFDSIRALLARSEDTYEMLVRPLVDDEGLFVDGVQQRIWLVYRLAGPEDGGPVAPEVARHLLGPVLASDAVSLGEAVVAVLDAYDRRQLEEVAGLLDAALARRLSAFGLLAGFDRVIVEILSECDDAAALLDSIESAAPSDVFAGR